MDALQQKITREKNNKEESEENCWRRIFFTKQVVFPGKVIPLTQVQERSGEGKWSRQRLAIHLW
jgi:hypothetical protein